MLCCVCGSNMALDAHPVMPKYDTDNTRKPSDTTLAHLNIVASLPQLLSPRSPNHDRLRLRLLHERQAGIDDSLPIHKLPIMQPLILQLRTLLPLLLEILFPLLSQGPLLGELDALLGRVMSKVKGHVFKHVALLALLHQAGDRLAEEALVLRLRVEFLA